MIEKNLARLAKRAGREHKIWWLEDVFHRDKTSGIFEAEPALPV
ncbi:uncharacterized protein METZ01_LOCUS511314, partial [marine metagenome]